MTCASVFAMMPISPIPRLCSFSLVHVPISPPMLDPALPLSSSCCRLRKDPLDPIDNGTKVAMLFKRLTDPEVQRREEAAKKAKEEAAAKAKESGRPAGAKAGAWGGLPMRR